MIPNLMGARVDKTQLNRPLLQQLPSMAAPNVMFIRPPNPTDEPMYSTQFCAPDAYSIFNLSPARIDPTLHDPNQSQEANIQRGRESMMCSPIKARGTPVFLSPMRIWGAAPVPMMSPIPGPQFRPELASVSPPGPMPGRIAKNKSGNKRYQYWTTEEDALVKYLREERAWTWKDISVELEVKLQGTHTWQAVQMRYLRALREPKPTDSAEPTEEEEPGAKLAKLAKLAKPGKPAKTKPARHAIIKEDPDAVPTSQLCMQLVEERIIRDWESRWYRLGAMMGADVSSADCAELLASQHECVRAFVEPDY